MMSAPETSDRPLPDLFRDLADNLSTLLRQEVQLAQAELSRHGKEAAGGVAMFGAAGTLGLLGLAALTRSLISALSRSMPAWAAGLAVATGFGAAAGGLVVAGRELLRRAASPVAEQAVESIRETRGEVAQAWQRARGATASA